MPLLKIIPAASLPAGPAIAADAAYPTAIGLFERQSCSDCPPANANLNAIADRPEVLALNFAVTFWDQLGWKDTFAKPSFTARQWDYAHPRAVGELEMGRRGADVGRAAAR